MTVSEQLSESKKLLSEKAAAELQARIEHFQVEPASVPAKVAKDRLERLNLMLDALKKLRAINQDQGF